MLIVFTEDYANSIKMIDTSAYTIVNLNSKTLNLKKSQNNSKNNNKTKR